MAPWARSERLTMVERAGVDRTRAWSTTEGRWTSWT